MSGAPAPLSPEEAAIVEQRWRAGAGGVRDRRLQGAGCVAAFVGMAALTLTPALAGWMTVDPALAYAILGLAVVMLVAGAAMGLIGAGRAGAGDRAAIEAAVAALLEAKARGASPVDEAATLLLRLQEASPGAAPPDLPARLAPVAGELQRVERYLIERRRLPPRPS